MANLKAWLLYCFFVYSLVTPNWGQFPRSCTDQNSISSRSCCPFSRMDGSQCGVRSGRGVCSNIPTVLAEAPINQSIPLLLDDRAWWPRAFYDTACVCFQNYDGVDCSECQPGFEGVDCRKRSPLKVRRNIEQLNSEELSRYIQVINAAKYETSTNYVLLTTSYDQILQGVPPVFVNASIYDIFVWLHYYVTRANQVFSPEETLSLLANYSTTNPISRRQIALDLFNSGNSVAGIEENADFGHTGPSFLPWHRYFLLKIENEIGNYVANDRSFALHYWDWRDSTVCDVCNDFMFGASNPNNNILIDSKSPFSQWPTICTRGSEYFESSQICTGQPEGNIIRDLGSFSPEKISGLPTSEQIRQMFVQTTFYDTPPFDESSSFSFRNMLEGFANPTTGLFDGMSHTHNAVHIWFNGTMSGTDTAANDPIFLSHHAYIDNIFETWIRKDQRLDYDERYRDSNGPNIGHRLVDYMCPFFPLVQNWNGFADTASLGYEYDYLLQAEPNTTPFETTTSGETGSRNIPQYIIICVIFVVTVVA